MAKSEIPNFGGAPKLDSRPEPLSSPSSSGVGGSFGGAPTIDGLTQKGEKQVGGPGADVWPKPYGGGAEIETRKGMKGASGSGDRTGAGGQGENQIP